MATNAFAELEANLTGGVGSAARDVVSSFSAAGNYGAVNLGQLKYIASLFYDRLIEEELAGSYPWTATKDDDSDFAVANLGQLKNVFNFSLNRLYADSGILLNSKISNWWNAVSVNLVSPSLQDGGFESSVADGATFPPSSRKWSMLTSGGQANAVVTTTAKHSGNNGLWAYTGTINTQYQTVLYQEYPTTGGDTWIVGAHVRQPVGNPWVAGTKAFARLKFLNSLGSNIGFTDSPSMVTAAGQTWTYCAVTGTATLGAWYVRLEIVLEKPQVAGQSVANFDDCYLQKCNAFLSTAHSSVFGDMPEGDNSFRTFAVNQAGWGVFVTNGTINLSSYTNGCLSFWLKSPAPSKVEVRSATGIATNTSVIATFGNTIESGVLVWQKKTIPVNSMANVNLSRVVSPFMFTDMGVTNQSFVDCVYWVKTP